MCDMTPEEIQAYRQMMTDFAEDHYELPATPEQIRYLADLIQLSHGALWQTFGTLTRGNSIDADLRTRRRSEYRCGSRLIDMR